ncbi:4-oxalocrotonate tautomerase DmpI [Propionispora hippei]|uniref:4-oxalocrotonate tautomerase n=1 Tax=Propionispora hippei DSM 15287 TaxID=1123003 RepID=A0A1M6DXP8_9FIRM|nr:4-oxalocrotonate tautomerase DmpI [Propionispora hippei]SHI78034.1 4-oxalocrotonate tautomerase [Propionispora hippei DSM 15287]
MPVITLEASKMSREQKAKLVQEFTESTLNILNVPKQSITVLIKENEKDNIGVAGQLLSDR